jgi:DNA-binding response OmpR family regulator
MTVMIIDDDEEDAQLLFDAIKDIAPDITCIVSHNYQNSKILLDEELAPDFIFLDAMMYPIGGKETLKRLTQMSKLSETKIIINSGFLSKIQVDEFNALGADRILQKPADYQSLMASVKDILSMV